MNSDVGWWVNVVVKVFYWLFKIFSVKQEAEREAQEGSVGGLERAEE